MSELHTELLGELAPARRGITYSESALRENAEDGLPYINMKSFLKDGGYNVEGLKYFAGFHTAADVTRENDLLIANTDVTRDGDIIGVPAFLPAALRESGVLFSHHVTRLNISTKLNVEYLYYLLCSDKYRRAMKRYARGTTVLMLDMQGIKRIPIQYPASRPHQTKIAAILTATDTAIEKTEALIAKYQQIKAGLMHDLFTRGVLPNGQLRPMRSEAPELYQETAIGWIPKDWQLKDVSMVLESVADGPFGSNLKTEHYVVDPGVRVVRLQNVAEHEYSDDDKAYISDRHAAFLVRNKVVGGDVLIAGLGEERYPVGRACTYPEQFPPAVNKADCFRARCAPDVMHNKYFMLFLNSELARHQIRRYEQGVTRPRINTGNLKRLIVGVPALNEQIAFIEKFETTQASIRSQQASVASLKAQKIGLMQDLLTGKVPVEVGTPRALPAGRAGETAYG